MPSPGGLISGIVAPCHPADLSPGSRAVSLQQVDGIALAGDGGVGRSGLDLGTSAPERTDTR